MDTRDIGAAQRRRPQTLAAVVALALIVAVGPFAVAGLRLDDLGRAVGRARETVVSTIETILGPRIVPGEPRRQADARAPAAPASRPVAVAPPATPPAGATADPGPPAEPAPASRVPDARGGRGSLPDSTLRPVPDPGMQPPPAPQPDEGSLLESLLGLLDVLPSVVLGDAEDTPEATGGPQETSGPGEAALNAVPETVEPLLGQSTDAEQVPAGGLAPQVSAQVALPQPPSAAATGPSEEATAQPPVNVRQFPAPGIGSKPAPGGTLFQPEG